LRDTGQNEGVVLDSSRMYRPDDHAVGRFAVVLGTNEIASAVGVHLHRDGWRVVLSHDPDPPVIRRRMAFHDVLFGETMRIDGICGARADNALRVLKALGDTDRIVVTRLGWLDVLAIRQVDLLVDARMQKYRVTPDLRPIAGLTIGLGPGFSVNANCDIAVETRPARTGSIVRAGRTDFADGTSRHLGGIGSERFVYAHEHGWWHTLEEIGVPVSKGCVLGRVNGMSVRAPLDGILRGIVRNGTKVSAGVKLLEVDPRGDHAQWTGIDERGRTIATATLNAIRVHAAHKAAAYATAVAN